MLLYLRKPSTSKEVLNNVHYYASHASAQTPSNSSQRLGDEDKRNGDQNVVECQKEIEKMLPRN